MHPIAETDPAQKLDHFGPIARFLASHRAQRQRHVLVGCEMVQETKVLEHNADPPPQRRQVVLAQRRGVTAKDANRSPRRAEREQHQPHEGRLARAGRTGEELKALRVDGKIEVANDLRSHAVAQTDVFEP